MATFRLEPNGYIYLYHWKDSMTPLKISTKLKIDPAKWDKKNQSPINPALKDKNGVKYIDTLVKYKGAMVSALEEIKHTRADLKVTFYNNLSGEVKRGGPMAVKETSFLEYFESKVNKFEADETSNYKTYKTTYNNLKVFLVRKRPAISELDRVFFDDFKRFCEKKKNYKLNMVNRQFKNIKSILGQAYEEKLIQNEDFRRYKIGTEKAVNISLTMAELEKIYNLKFHNHLHLDRVRDSFIVAAFTGLRFEDWGRVTSRKVVDNILNIRSTKTKEVSQIPIHKYVKAILKKYKGKMPEQISNQKTNKALKTIGQVARLNQEVEKPYTKGGKLSSDPDVLKKWQMITTHTARRSLCTNLIKQGANPFVVMIISGHKNMDSFQKYVNLDEILVVDTLKKLPMFEDES